MHFLLEADLQLISSASPVLRSECDPVPAEYLPKIAGFCRRMLDFMYLSHGVGLAATQIGLPAQIFVMNPAPPHPETERIVINPEILHFGTRVTVVEEGCLSLPGLHALVERPSKVVVRYTDLAGQTRKYCFEGLTSRIFQHEYDHLHKTLFIDRLDEARLAQLAPALTALGVRTQKPWNEGN